MSNPTTPFSWQMPTATDLVTDLPADFEVFGQAVATSMADLLGGTSGQILAKNSNTDMDFVWIANDQGDITGITATSPLTGGGTSGAVTVGIQDGTTAQKGAVQLENSTSSTSTTTAAVPASVKTAYDLAAAAVAKSTVTTNGDLIYGTGSSTVTRLGIGSTSQVLTVTGGVPTWATPAGGGGMTLLSTTTLSGASTTISSISGSYKTLILEIFGVTNASADGDFRVNPNATANITDFIISYFNTNGAATSTGATSSTIKLSATKTIVRTNAVNAWTLVITDYASTTARKPFYFSGGFNTAAGDDAAITGSGLIKTTSAISSISLNNTGGNFSTGTVLLYGVN